MTKTRARLAVFISGGGTGMQAMIDASKRGDLAAEIVLIVSSTRKAYGLERAATEGIDSYVFRPKRFDTPRLANEELLARLVDHKVDYIALSGYLRMLSPEILRAFPGRIVNIHPGLLPKYGGQGMYGAAVHQAVLAAGDKESGPTVHIVDEIYDHGRILDQSKVPVVDGDTSDSLAARVLIEEHKFYPIVIDNLIKGKYELNDD